MSAANDNSSRTVRSLALPVFAMIALPVAGGGRVDLAKGGVYHTATVTLRTVPASLGKSQAFTGGTKSNLRAAPDDINAVAGALAAMIAELPVRGGILDRLA